MKLIRCSAFLQKKWQSMWLTKIATFFLLLLLLLSQLNAAQSENSPKLTEPAQPTSADRQKILFLNTYQSGLPIPDSIERGFLAALHEGGVSVNDIFIEHLDLARGPSKEYRNIMADQLRRKLFGKQIGLIIVEGVPALNFLKTEARGLFPEAAVLSLITPGIDSLRDGPYKIIDIPWRVDPAGTLRVALDLFSKTRRVIVVTGARDSILPFLEEAKNAFAPYKTLDFEYTNEMTYEQMLNRISSLPSDSIIIYSPFFSDTSGRSFVPAEVVVKVCQLATVPVFATLEAYLGRGIVGGALLKTETIGHQAGKIALDYLDGNLQLIQPITTFNTSTPNMLDWQKLEHWKANTSALPKDSIIINRPLTMMGQYKGEVITAAIAFLCLSVMVLALLVFNRRLKRWTIAASDSEARFRVMMEYAPEAIVVYDLDRKRIIDVNPTAEKFFGCKMQMLLKEDLERFYQSDQVDKMSVAESMAEYHRRALAGEEVRFEQTVYTDDQRELQCEIRLVQLPFKGQRFLRASLIDITDRKKAEEELRKSEGHLRTLVQTIPDLIWLKDQGGVYLSCNQIFERFFGAKESNIIGKTDYDFVDRELADFFVENDNKAMLAGKPTINEEWITFADDGHHVLLETIKTPMYDSIGTLIGVLGIGRDITERKRAEEETSILEVQLQQAQKMEAIGQLAGGVAHDFNNMLGVIHGHAEMAMELIDPGQPLYTGLNEILKAAERSTDIARQLLAFARKQTIAPIIIDLNEAIEGMLKMLRRLIGEDIDLLWMPGSDLWPVKVDPSQIDQILANLCINARAAIAGVGEITVMTENSVLDEYYSNTHADSIPGEYVKITVSDSGCGMDKITLAHIFEPFFTTKDVGEGTGLGLATVFGAVKQNNGTINVYSEPGQGTNFTIYLPRYLGDLEQGKTSLAMDPTALGHETILLVEDEAAILAMTVRMLERLGYTVLTANAPDAAISLTEEFSGEIHVLLTDVIMPGMNGRDLADLLLKAYPKMRCLFMSGYTANIISSQGVLSEGMNFIQKPFSKKELAAKIRQVVENRKS